MAPTLIWWAWRWLRERAARHEAAPPFEGPPQRPPMVREEALRILGPREGASSAEIIAAHRSLIKKLHPDHGGSDHLAQQVNEAKRVLQEGARAVSDCLRPEELVKGPFMKALMVVTLVGLSLVGCGDDGPGEKPYCCAVQKVAADFTYQEEYRAGLSRVAAAENEDACKTVVEANFERFEDAFYACF